MELLTFIWPFTLRPHCYLPSYRPSRSAALLAPLNCTFDLSQAATLAVCHTQRFSGTPDLTRNPGAVANEFESHRVGFTPTRHLLDERKGHVAKMVDAAAPGAVRS